MGKIKVELSVADVVYDAGSFEESLDQLGLSSNLAISTENGDDLPCYLDQLLGSQYINNTDQARIAVYAAMCAIQGAEAVILVSTTSREPAHKFWLELAEEVSAPMTTIQRDHGSNTNERLVYTILFAATPYIPPVAKTESKVVPAKEKTKAAAKSSTSKWI